MGNIFTVETDLIWTRITKMPWKIALSASGNLGSTFDINLVCRTANSLVWVLLYGRGSATNCYKYLGRGNVFPVDSAVPRRKELNV